MPPPQNDPVGLDVARTGRLVGKAFDDELTAAGASLPVWLVVSTLKRGDHAMQRDIAAAIGIEGATLTHHLARMEAAGLISRRRVPENRRTQVVELTDTGNALFFRLLDVVVAFDARLRHGLTKAEEKALHDVLARLRHNATHP